MINAIAWSSLSLSLQVGLKNPNYYRLHFHRDGSEVVPVPPPPQKKQNNREADLEIIQSLSHHHLCYYYPRLEVGRYRVTNLTCNIGRPMYLSRPDSRKRTALILMDGSGRRILPVHPHRALFLRYVHQGTGSQGSKPGWNNLSIDAFDASHLADVPLDRPGWLTYYVVAQNFSINVGPEEGCISHRHFLPKVIDSFLNK